MSLLSLRLSRSIMEAAGKFASSRLRELGRKTVAADWQQRAAVCERCPMRVVQCGVSYCGKPFLQQIEREPAIDGCGCPCRDKARDPAEHCPVDARHQPSITGRGGCTCKWCAPATALPSAA